MCVIFIIHKIMTFPLIGINIRIFFSCVLSAEPFCDADIAKSLLIGISNDIGQLAYLQANIHGMKNIYFGGYFIRGHPMTMHTITYAINYWSKVRYC